MLRGPYFMLVLYWARNSHHLAPVVYNVDNAIHRTNSLRRVLEISSFALKKQTTACYAGYPGINLYPVDNAIGPPSIFIRCLVLSKVLTTVVWLTNLRLTVHSFYHLLSPSILRFTGILKLYGKERSETRIWAHTWKSNLRINGQMC